MNSSEQVIGREASIPSLHISTEARFTSGEDGRVAFTQYLRRVSQIVTAGALSVFTAYASAQGMTKADINKLGEREEYKCLAEVSKPWSFTLADEKLIPEQFKAWGPAFVGHWVEADGQLECSALLVTEIKENGTMNALYTNGRRYPRYHEMSGTITGNTVTLGKRDTTWSIVYSLNADGTLKMDLAGAPVQKSGALKRVPRTPG